jgi:nicotinate-nucleotide adenylyltransferase
MDLSSAMIRERIAEGSGKTAWHYLVPRGARLIIEDRGLYWPISCAGGEISSEVIARVEDAARAALSAKRFIHSRNTALVARDLALRYGLDAQAAYLAGIAHDMAKGQSPGLSHGRAAAVLLRERFGIHNRDVLEAVEFHTTGKPGMGDLSKAVFIADKIEYSRQDVSDTLKEMAVNGNLADKGFSLDELFCHVLENNIHWLRETGINVAEESLRLLEADSAKSIDL